MFAPLVCSAAARRGGGGREEEHLCHGRGASAWHKVKGLYWNVLFLGTEQAGERGERAGWGGLTAALESSVVITSDRLCEAKAGVRAGVSVLARLVVGSCWERGHVPGR